MRRVVILAVLGTLIFAVPAFAWRIGEVEVTGSARVPNAAIRDAALTELQGSVWGIFPRSSMLLVRTHRIEGALRSLFTLERVSIKRRLSGRLQIVVSEQPAAAMVQFPDTSRMVLSRSGEITAVATESSDGSLLPEIRWSGTAPELGMSLMNAETLALLTKLWTELGQAGSGLQPIYVADRAGSSFSAFDIQTIGGTVVTITAGPNAEQQLNKIRAVLRNYSTPEARAKLRMIDLRYGDRVYIQ